MMRLLTEEEARGTWCPMARIWSRHGDKASGGWNRNPVRFGGNETHDGCNCIASKCAMWEFYHSTAEEKPTRGYCGLKRG